MRRGPKQTPREYYVTGRGQERRMRILRFLVNYPQATQADLITYSGLAPNSYSTLRHHLDKLELCQMLEPGTFQVTAKGRAWLEHGDLVVNNKDDVVGQELLIQQLLTHH